MALHQIREQLDYVDGLDNNIKKSIKWYTGSQYESFNYALRTKTDLTTSKSKHLANLDKAFDNVPLLENEITVYRGINSGKIYKNAFVSTSLSKEVAVYFINDRKCCLMHITLSKGSRILPIFNVSKKSGEEEILLSRHGDITCTHITMEGKMKVLHCVYTTGILIKDKADLKYVVHEFDPDK
jgi:hypothetical protein